MFIVTLINEGLSVGNLPCFLLTVYSHRPGESMYSIFDRECVHGIPLSDALIVSTPLSRRYYETRLYCIFFHKLIKQGS